MMNWEDIIYKRVKAVKVIALDYDEASKPMIIEIIFEMETGKLLSLKAEPNYDEIIINILSSNPPAKHPYAKVFDFINSNENSIFSHCINKSFCWLWMSRNNQNYEDVFECELHGEFDRLSLRFLVEGSEFKIGKIENMEIDFKAN
ncbi:DUF6334 family protein [Aureibacter tunicatorum]|uniref:Uncharacterized protein n=1 Tax=Aureibacter tunicatorum TaxID=866807 RepID=A0AAE4BSJ8_9BACT|nr:DUF6334 family protein [Aureibacter tunicatorum]MDR6238497.1 hypothetical protein [Aureibacter tunicatorum]BDD05570.1 hypothetical protein AUTU_30530 [Aureibacter tunicatorum]